MPAQLQWWAHMTALQSVWCRAVCDWDIRWCLVSIECVMKLLTASEAEKVALVSKIQWDQKIMEKESEKKMAEIEGQS